MGALPLVLAAPAGAITLGQVDDFQDGSLQNWEPANFLLNVAGVGPEGPDDRFLQYSSSGDLGGGGGGAGTGAGRMVVYNGSQWAGDYASAGVDKVSLWAVNKGSTELNLRIAIGTGLGRSPADDGTWYATTIALSVPADNIWRSYQFDLAELEMTKLLGTNSFFFVLQNVSQLRVLSSSSPTNRGDLVAGTLGLDKITAIPEPSAGGLFAFGLVGLAWRSRARGAHSR